MSVERIKADGAVIIADLSINDIGRLQVPYVLARHPKVQAAYNELVQALDDDLADATRVLIQRLDPNWIWDGVKWQLVGNSLPLSPVDVKELVIEGVTDAATYSLTVDGSLEKFEDARRGISINPSDVINNMNAVGAVSIDGKDGYRYSGMITAFEVTGEVSVTIDGIAVLTIEVVGK